MKKRPFLFMGLASFLAVLLCSLTTPTCGIAAACAAAIVLCGCSFCRRVPLRPSMTALVGVTAVLMALLFSWRIESIVRPQLALDGTTATVTVRVESKLPSADAYLVRVEDGELETGLRLCFWAGYRQIAPKSGDRLTATVALVAAYDETSESGSAAKANGVFLYAWPTSDSRLYWEDGQASLVWYDRVVYTLRENIHNILYRRMTYDGAAFSEGMMFGECGNIAVATSNAFRISGVYHLLAVSGSHLVLITAAVFRLLGLCGVSRRMRAILTLAAIVLFTALCGFVASVVRAAVSTAIILSGHLFHRRSDGLNSLGFAALAMLTSDPFCMYDIGWQLSFAATLGLLLFVPVWDKEITGRITAHMPMIAAWMSPVSTAVGVTFCASLATMPITALHFGGVSTVFLLANLLCVPLSEALLMANFLSVMTAWLEPLSDALFIGCEWLCDLMTLVAERLASFPFALLIASTWVVLWMFVFIFVLVIGYRLRGMRGLFRACVGMLAVLVIGSAVSSVIHRDSVRITVAPSSEIAVTVHAGRDCGVIVAGNSTALKEAMLLLRDEGIPSPKWVLWLGEPSGQTVDLAYAPSEIGLLVTGYASEQYLTLPDANGYAALAENTPLTSAEGVTLEHCGDVWRLLLQETSVLIVPSEHADLSALPPSWVRTDLLLLAALPDGVACIEAEQTIVCCDFGEQDKIESVLPDAVYAVKGGALQFRMGSTLRE